MAHLTDSDRTVTCRGCGTDRDPHSIDASGLCPECSREAEVAAARRNGELGALLPSDLDSPETAAEIARASQDTEDAEPTREELLEENDALRAEIDRLRALLGMAARGRRELERDLRDLRALND